uniref:Major facilitator superfamily (MFS) profile domain-containing protein n=1 Tax=Strigamia maritima TaxID=126957 RepID=T1JDA5_STRMM
MSEEGSATPPGEHFSSLFWKKKHATIAYCCVFWSFGMCVAFLGPTQIDLGCKTGSSFTTMSWVFFVQTLFILVGSATGAIIAKRKSCQIDEKTAVIYENRLFDSNLILFVSIIVLAVTLAVIPLCYTVILLALVLAIMGYFMGVIDTLANVCMITLYGKDVSPFLQALHFFYGLGAFVSPLIAEPFLIGKSCNETTREQLEQNEMKESRISYVFWIMSLLQIPIIIVVFTMTIRKVFIKEDTETKQREEYEVMDNGIASKQISGLKSDINGSLADVVDDHPPATKTQALVLTLLTAVLLFLYDGLQAAYGGYGTFAFGRLISIALSTKLSPEFMLVCNICGCIFSFVFMLCFPHHHAAIYIGTFIFGIFLSSVYPTSISLTEKYITVLASCIIVGAATGEMMFPVLVGHLFEMPIGPIGLLITGLVVTILSLIVYAAIWLLGNSIIRRTATPGMMGLISSFIPKRSSEEEDSGLVTHHVKYYSRMKSNMSESSFGGDAPSEGGLDIDEETTTTAH